MTSTIGEILPVAAQRFGARTALLVGGRSFSFDELHALSSRAANGLVAAGVEAGDRVALYGPNCWEWLVAYRMKDMILTAGFNVYPAEIERVLCAHPAVALAAVGAIPDETKGELAKAYVILKPDTDVTREELIAHCRQHLAAYKVPRAIQFTTQVPTTSSGKIMRRLLTDIDDGTTTATSDPSLAAT
jgi:acyl-CoA synthetase (AMP-forming)/AMP-acid ligase II